MRACLSASRAARLDEDEIQARRRALGFPEAAFPELHLSPSLRSPKAREALRQPLFNSPTPVASKRAAVTTPGRGQATSSASGGYAGLSSGAASGGARERPSTEGHQEGYRSRGPIPEKLELSGE